MRAVVISLFMCTPWIMAMDSETEGPPSFTTSDGQDMVVEIDDSFDLEDQLNSIQVYIAALKRSIKDHDTCFIQMGGVIVNNDARIRKDITILEGALAGLKAKLDAHIREDVALRRRVTLLEAGLYLQREKIDLIPQLVSQYASIQSRLGALERERRPRRRNSIS